MTVVGARPQFVKAAAVSRALSRRSGVREVLVHTGQHFDPEMSDIFFEELALPRAAHHLGISGGKHGDMTGRMLAGLEALMIDVKPGWVLVYGDTNSTLAAALAAAKLHVPVAHVEAGLRSFNRRMPEEINRILTDHVSSLLFCPTGAAVSNLAAEGVSKGVHHTGDVMYDVMLHSLQRARASSRILECLDLRDGCYAVATVHRAENTDDESRLRRIFEFLREESEKRTVVLPLHPRTKQAIEKGALSTGTLTIVPPLGYIDMVRLVAGASDVYTDSGGLQKEAYFLRKPCVTLREETEWVETVAAGWNRLWHVSDYAPRIEIEDYGDGDAGSVICAYLIHAFG